MPEPFQQQELVFGVQGLDLKRSLDLIPPTKLSRMNNVVRPEEGSLTGRAGQTTQFNTGSDLSTHHSIGRLNNRFQGTFTYLLGAGTSVYAGTTGTLTQVATGFSGNPLSLAAYHPPVSGDSWMYIGDSTKMGKVRGSDSLFTTIGLKPGISKDNRFRIDEFKAKPSGTIGGRDRTRFTCFGFDVSGAGPGTAGNFTAYAAQSKTTIDTCDTAGWTNNAGTGGSPTNVVDGAVFKQGTASLKLTTNPGGAAYYNFFNKANPLNLNTLGTGGTPATDDDIIHLWIRTDRPDILLEARVYFVLNSAFDLNTLPGISATLNTEAYMKIFRPSDFTPQFETSTGTLSQAGTVNTNFDALTGLPIITDTRASVMPIAQQFDQSKSASLQIGPGRGAWTEFGVIGLPIHRRDFRRLGTDTTRNWANVTGMVLAVQVTTNTAINVWFDDIYLTGGAGLDSSLLGLQPYDYRYRNFDPRTGAVSNPSPVQGIGFRLDSLRQGIVLTPSMYGDPAIRQQFFRRGGSINSQWLLAGVNTSDGGTFTDTQSDAAISASIALTFDNDQPVTTVDASGNALLAQPLPAIFGPVMDLLYGCGDPHRAGDLYWCKPTMLDSWPFSFHVEVCTPSEELMNGFAWGGQPYVFSRERLFAIYPNLSNAGQVSTQPTGCTHGLAGRWAFAVGAGGVYFAAKDGIYQVQGGPEVSISDQDVRGLFHGETRNGYLSVDFSHPEALRMAIFDNELWFSYRDTSGVNRTLIYSVLFQFWRFNQFGSEVASFYTEEGTSLSLLMGGRATGKTYQYSGTTDDGAAITSSYRTGALNQGDPRSNKLYGDISLDADVKGNTISVTPFLNNELTSLAPLTIATGVGRQRYYLDLAATVARNISFDFSWTTSSTPPNIWQGGPSYTLQPHTIETRVTNWDNQGQLGAKLVKGIKLEINTFGVAKTYNVQADGATATTFTVNTPDRRVQEFAWPQFTGRTLRIQPADAVDAMLYDLRWLFDEEPQFLTRWETQELGHGIDGWQFPVYGHITTRSTAPVFLTITAFRQDGTSLPVTYTIPSTAGAKIKQYVQFQMQKGILFKYLFTSDVQPFYLYKEESEVWVQPWGGQEARVVHNFGDDDLDQGRQMRDASLVAARSNYGF